MNTWVLITLAFILSLHPHVVHSYHGEILGSITKNYGNQDTVNHGSTVNPGLRRKYKYLALLPQLPSQSAFIHYSAERVSMDCWPCVVVLISSLVTGLVNCFTIRGWLFLGAGGGGTNNAVNRPIRMPFGILSKPINVHHWEGSSSHHPISFLPRIYTINQYFRRRNNVKSAYSPLLTGTLTGGVLLTNICT